MQTKKVILADGQQLMIDGLQALLENNPTYNFEVLFATHSGKELLGYLQGAQFDLLIIDLQLEEKHGFEVLELLKKRNVDFKILVLSGEKQTAILRKVLEYPIDGFVSKLSPFSTVLEALECIFEGQKYYDQALDLTGIGREALDKVLSSSSDERMGKTFVDKFDITKRELEVLQLLAQAHSNLEIGKLLFISEQTVTVHRKSLMRKLCVRNIAALIKIAYDNNLV